MTINESRRRTVFGASAVTTLATLGIITEGLTQSASSGYRALVCIFLNGGNDGNNTLIPLDGGFSDYKKARSSLALSSTELLKLPGIHSDRVLGVHPACSELATLFNVHVGLFNRRLQVQNVFLLAVFRLEERLKSSLTQ